MRKRFDKTREERDEAFLAFFEREAVPLQRFAMFMSGDRDAAPDLAQEALMKTLRAWNRIKNNDAAGYARKVIVNQVRDSHRRARIRRLKPLGALPESSPSAESATDDRLTMAEMLKSVPPARRAVLVLRFYEDMSERQIAELLDRPVGTIKSDLHRGLAVLRPLVTEQLERLGG